MVNIATRHVFTPHPQVMVAFTGLEGDVQSLSQDLLTEVSAKLGRSLGFSLTGTTTTTTTSSKDDSSEISPRAMAVLTSHILYHRRRAPYYVQPLVVGLSKSTAAIRRQVPVEDDHQSTGPMDDDFVYVPFLCAMDMIGAKSFSESFVCSGAATKSLYGTAEALWRPNLEPEELAEVCGKAFQSALERDCLSGYGAIIYLITKDEITEYELASRND